MATIAENLQTIQNIKQDIKRAIENKGVDMSNTPFTEYSSKIDEISSGGGTPTKIDVAATGIKLAYSTFTEIPDIFDFSNVTNMGNMFNNCSMIQTIPMLDTSNVTGMYGTFINCGNLQTIPLLDTHNVTTMNYLFQYCSSLQTIPMLITSNVTNMGSMFNSCSKLQTIPMLDTSNVNNMSSLFSSCKSLQSIPLLDCGNVTNMSSIFGYSNISTLTDIGGFRDLKISVTSNFLERCPNLTTDSLMNVINNVYDLTTNGLSGKSLKFGQTNLDKLTPEQVAVATAKGWALTA